MQTQTAGRLPLWTSGYKVNSTRLLLPRCCFPLETLKREFPTFNNCCKSKSWLIKSWIDQGIILIFYYSISSELNVVLIQLFLYQLIRRSSSLCFSWKTRRKRSTSRNQCRRLQTVTSLKHYTNVITTANILTVDVLSSPSNHPGAPQGPVCTTGPAGYIHCHHHRETCTKNRVVQGQTAHISEFHLKVPAEMFISLRECRMKRSLQLMRMWR